MKVTIGIPVYNQAPYVANAIESALNQTVQCEVIVVNDGSTDGSWEIAKKFPIRVISQVNKGLAAARNTAIMNMTGEYFLPLDADDMLLDTCVEKIIKKIEETDADIVAPSFKTYGSSNEEIILMTDPQLENFKNGNRIGYCSAIWIEALKQVGGYSPRMVHGYEDFHLWINLLTMGKNIATIPEVLWLYLTKEKSMWKEALNHHQELLAQINKDFPQAKVNF